MMKYITVPVFLLFSLFIGSCGKLEMLPSEPRISFESFSVFDTTDLLGNDVRGGRLRFYFEDGDGDVGLPPPPPDTEDLKPDSINLFVSLYRVKNGVTAAALPGDPYYPTGFRIPYMVRNGRNKILRGHITALFTYLFYSEDDSVKYEFYIKDRAGNISNTETTGVISIFNKGVYE